MKSMLLSGIVLLLSTSVQAQQNMIPNVTPSGTIPPAQYDHPYKGVLTVKPTSRENLPEDCPGLPLHTLACAHYRVDQCTIYVIDDANALWRYGWTREQLLRHEIAHCNGWPPHHPGLRYPFRDNIEPNIADLEKRR